MKAKYMLLQKEKLEEYMKGELTKTNMLKLRNKREVVHGEGRRRRRRIPWGQGMIVGGGIVTVVLVEHGFYLGVQ